MVFKESQLGSLLPQTTVLDLLAGLIPICNCEFDRVYSDDTPFMRTSTVSYQPQRFYVPIRECSTQIGAQIMRK